MKVTQVEPQKKPRRYNIYLDGKFAFGADEDLVVSHRLVIGKDLNPGDLELILFEAEVGKLMERMYALFNIRPRSEKEVRDYLRTLAYKRKIKDQDEISDVSIQSLIDKLYDKGLLNDEQFAKDWIEARSKKYGINRIKQELYQKGISREIIDNEIRDNRYEINSVQTAKKLLERKMRVWKNLVPMESKRKATEFLMRKGFEYSVVKETIEKILKKD